MRAPPDDPRKPGLLVDVVRAPDEHPDHPAPEASAKRKGQGCQHAEVGVGFREDDHVGFASGHRVGF